MYLECGEVGSINRRNMEDVEGEGTGGIGFEETKKEGKEVKVRRRNRRMAIRSRRKRSKEECSER